MSNQYHRESAPKIRTTTQWLVRVLAIAIGPKGRGRWATKATRLASAAAMKTSAKSISSLLTVRTSTDSQARALTKTMTPAYQATSNATCFTTHYLEDDKLAKPRRWFQSNPTRSIPFRFYLTDGIVGTRLGSKLVREEASVALGPPSPGCVAEGSPPYSGPPSPNIAQAASLPYLSPPTCLQSMLPKSAS